MHLKPELIQRTPGLLFHSVLSRQGHTTAAMAAELTSSLLLQAHTMPQNTCKLFLILVATPVLLAQQIGHLRPGSNLFKESCGALMPGDRSTMEFCNVL